MLLLANSEQIGMIMTGGYWYFKQGMWFLMWPVWLDLIVSKHKSKRVTTLQEVYSIFITYFVCLFVYLIWFLFTDKKVLSMYYLLLFLRGITSGKWTLNWYSFLYLSLRTAFLLGEISCDCYKMFQGLLFIFYCTFKMT